MIDLSRTRQQMLDEIGASDAERFPDFGRADDGPPAAGRGVQVVCRGHSRSEIMPGLTAALRRLFPAVPDGHLESDLFYLLEKGLGNADKRGNRRDPAKWITAECVVTPAGAVVSITDEGDGFDVEAVLKRFKARETYFEHGGSGFDHFDRSKSVVSYADGGRTVLIGFSCHPDPGRLVSRPEAAAFGRAADEGFMRSFLETEVPYFVERGAVVNSCRGYSPSDENEKKLQSEFRYAINYRSKDAPASEEIVLTGRLLPLAAGRTDVTVAGQLHDGSFHGTAGIRIPKPLAMCEDPPLALSALDPAESLRTHVKRLVRFDQLGSLLERVAIALMTLHHSTLPSIDEAPLEVELMRHRSVGRRIEARLAGSPDRQTRVRRCVERLIERAGLLAASRRVPIHGALDWDCFAFGPDDALYLYRFEQCRRSHPGLDLGGFLAELERFYLLRDRGNPDFYWEGRRVLLESYASGIPPPWLADLDWFIAGAMLQRMDRVLTRSEKRWERKADALIGRCEELLG